MVSFSYFISEILLQDDPNKLRNPSKFTYYFPYFILEFLFLLLVILLFHSNYLLIQPLFWYFPIGLIYNIIILFILIIIICLLCADLFYSIRESIIGDLHKSLDHDFHEKSEMYGQDYTYFEERMAYKRSEAAGIDDSLCKMCNGDMWYHWNETKILKCGHIYCGQCIQFEEEENWDDYTFMHPMSQCPNPQCHEMYDTRFEKWDYNYDYVEEMPCYLQPNYNYFGSATSNKFYWDFINKDYMEYKNKEISERPDCWSRFKKCITAIITNNGSLILWTLAAFLWKWIQFPFRVMVFIAVVILYFIFRIFLCIWICIKTVCSNIKINGTNFFRHHARNIVRSRWFRWFQSWIDLEWIMLFLGLIFSLWLTYG